MVDDYMLNKVLNRIKETIGIEKFDNTKVLINADDKSLDDITLKKVVIKDNNKFYPQLFLKHVLYVK